MNIGKVSQQFVLFLFISTAATLNENSDSDDYQSSSFLHHEKSRTDTVFQSHLTLQSGEKISTYNEYIPAPLKSIVDGIKKSNEDLNGNHLSYTSSLDKNFDMGKNSSNLVEQDQKAPNGMLEEFGIGKLGSTDAANMLPIFLMEPENSFVVKNRPAVLKCKAIHALQLHFKCSGSSQPPPSTHDKHVDPHTGTHMEEVTTTIHRDLVDEYFGKGPFKCECHAWSSRGVVKSQSATISIAFIRKQFVTSPTSLRVEIGTMAELKCHPPNGYPEPKIMWLKNNFPVTESQDLSIASSEGSLRFRKIGLQDMANYTCVAENIAGKRISESAVIIVYVNGGWSPWGSWKDCKCAGKLSQGRKRTRSCSNPIPLNGGTQCSGPQMQKSSDCLPCLEDTQIVTTDALDTMNKRNGRWSQWSEWSSCSVECIQVRRRKCINQYSEEHSASSTEILGSINKLSCVGKDTQIAECRGEECLIGNNELDWTIYLVLVLVVVVFFAFGSVLLFSAKCGIRNTPHYNITATVMEPEYLQGVEKKEIRMHMEATNAGYDYVNPSHGFFHNESLINTTTEHHYDVPNLSTNYTNPIDDLSVDYLSDTAESSTGQSSNSTFDVKYKAHLSKHSASAIYSHNGGILGIYNNEIMLFIPEMAINKPSKKNISIALLGDDSSRISSINSEKTFVCSPIVYCTPNNFTFVKPVILKMPHCLTDPKDWDITIYHADNDHNDINVNWRKIITVGEETINTPMFVQIEQTHIYLMTEQLGRFVVIGSPKNPFDLEGSIKMKLFAFNQITPSNSNKSLRVYVVKDFPNSRDICSKIEAKLGGSYMGESQTFAFHLNNCNLKIRICSPLAVHEDFQNINLYEQLIPYNHILSSNTILHCEFTIKNNSRSNYQSYKIEFHQMSEDFKEVNYFLIPTKESDIKDPILEKDVAISVDKQGNYVNETISKATKKLPIITRRLIMSKLDPPRADEKDWRLLAKKLNADRYIAYFATKTSPTEQILNLWECRALNSKSTIVDLLITLREMDRPDILDIIVETVGPLWI